MNRSLAWRLLIPAAAAFLATAAPLPSSAQTVMKLANFRTVTGDSVFWHALRNVSLVRA